MADETCYRPSDLMILWFIMVLLNANLTKDIDAGVITNALLRNLVISWALLQVLLLEKPGNFMSFIEVLFLKHICSQCF